MRPKRPISGCKFGPPDRASVSQLFRQSDSSNPSITLWSHRRTGRPSIATSIDDLRATLSAHRTIALVRMSRMNLSPTELKRDRVVIQVPASSTNSRIVTNGTPTPAAGNLTCNHEGLPPRPEFRDDSSAPLLTVTHVPTPSSRDGFRPVERPTPTGLVLWYLPPVGGDVSTNPLTCIDAHWCSLVLSTKHQAP